MNNNLSGGKYLRNAKLNSRLVGIIAISLGIVGSFIITSFTDYLYIHAILNRSDSGDLGSNLVFIYYGIILIFSIFGFVKGIIELRLPEKRLAVIGMILGLVGIVVSLFMAYLSLAFYAL